jgi:hypothetical protein
MVCVWPLSPSSCEVTIVVVVVINKVVKKTFVVVAWSSDFVSCHTYCAFGSVKTLVETYLSTCVIVYPSIASFVISPPCKSIGEFD